MKWYEYILLVASIITALTVIYHFLKKALSNVLSEINKPVMDYINKMDVRYCRGWLVDFLTDIENGVEKDEVQYKFAHELYDYYTDILKENSYIHDKWERVMK